MLSNSFTPTLALLTATAFSVSIIFFVHRNQNEDRQVTLEKPLTKCDTVTYSYILIVENETRCDERYRKAEEKSRKQALVGRTDGTPTETPEQELRR